MTTRLFLGTGIAAILALAVFVPAAQAGSVVGTEHDMSSQVTNSQRVCVFCHTPHQPDTPTLINVNPLWNHTLSAIGSYGVYTSDTFDGSATINDIGGQATVSNLCMSCHDGTVGIGSLYNNPNNLTGGGEETPNNVTDMMTGNALVGTDLTNDHPVNFTYDNALAGIDGGLVDPTTSTTVQSWLFGGTVQCASCHDPHDDQYSSFLVASNINSAMCLTCHLK